ncbi:MAG: hypothetical protein IPM88_09895 [Nitrospira sp.]|nr:hypothetical protein [Nitrospira sp.]
MAGVAGDKVDRLAYGHCDSKIQGDASMLAVWARNLFQAIGYIRLSPKVKLHICVDGKIVPTFQADRPTFPIWLQCAPVDAKGIGLTDCALDTRQPFFYRFKRRVSHQFLLE